MRVYKITTLVATILSFLFGLLAIMLHFQWYIVDLSIVSLDDKSKLFVELYNCACDNEFWSNFCLSIFGSSMLTMLTSLLMYHHERRKTLESFLYHTRQLMNMLNRYQLHMTDDQKVSFFLAYHDFDKMAWDTDFGNMDFFFERIHKNRAYIYYKIYDPIIKFNDSLNECAWNLRWYLDGSGKNENVIKDYIHKLEIQLIRTALVYKRVKEDVSNNSSEWVGGYYISEPRLTHQIREELGGRYHDIMYNQKGKEKEKQ